jgi:hypothetical protein
LATSSPVTKLCPRPLLHSHRYPVPFTPMQIHVGRHTRLKYHASRGETTCLCWNSMAAETMWSITRGLTNEGHVCQTSHGGWRVGQSMMGSARTARLSLWLTTRPTLISPDMELEAREVWSAIYLMRSSVITGHRHRSTAITMALWPNSTLHPSLSTSLTVIRSREQRPVAESYRNPDRRYNLFISLVDRAQSMPMYRQTLD